MTPGGPNHTHPSPDRVLACPGCNVAGQLYRRQDDSVRCQKCGHEFAVGDEIDRPPERGRNLTAELRSKGGKESPADPPPIEACRRGGENGIPYSELHSDE